MSQVVRMEFFGSKTAPCRFPYNPSRNAKLYTVPVKLMFRDKKTAQTAAELSRTYLSIQPPPPESSYHTGNKWGQGGQSWLSDKGKC